MYQWFSKHWRAFWHSGPENLYTFIWWTIFSAILAAVGTAASWLLPHIISVSPIVAAIAAGLEIPLLAVFIALITCCAGYLDQSEETAASELPRASGRSTECSRCSTRSCIDADFY
jgi:hypothetical protein